MLQLARFYVESFPAFADPGQRAKLAARLSPAGAREHVRQAAEGLLTPFSTLGPEYFVLDPLGLLEFVDPASREAGGFAGFDLEWGSGGRFFSRDHRALLVVAEPREPASDYEFAVRLMTWTRSRIAAILAEPGPDEGPLRMTPVGAHAYADQSRALIERNIRVASIVSVIGNLLLLALVYRWLPAMALTILPTFLAILWTTGLISSYPGEVNLISLAFIAILTGLGDDQVTYFFTRVPQETSEGRSLAEAIRRTYVTTGKSVLFCMLASGTATLTLAMASFKGLAELGLVLTVGLAMLLVHTLFTIPALLYLVLAGVPGADRGRTVSDPAGAGPGRGAVVARFPGQVLAAGVVRAAGGVRGDSFDAGRGQAREPRRVRRPRLRGPTAADLAVRPRGGPAGAAGGRQRAGRADPDGGPAGRARTRCAAPGSCARCSPRPASCLHGRSRTFAARRWRASTWTPPPRRWSGRWWRAVWTGRPSRPSSPGCASGARAACRS